MHWSRSFGVRGPDATIAWTDGVSPALKTDLQGRLFVGHGDRETIQMLFRGDGYVIVHSKEEDPREEDLLQVGESRR